MGKSRGCSCFKIFAFACGSISFAVDDDELESKNSSDKRGWSFRKKSSRHRVFSNTVGSETPSGNKDCAETANANQQPESNSTIPEKASVIQWAEEKSQFSTVEKSQVSADEKPPVLEDVKPPVLADEKPLVSVDEKPQLSTDEKPQLLAEVSADEKSMISEAEKPKVSEDGKPSVASDEKVPVASEEKPLVSALVDTKISAPVTTKVNDGKPDATLDEHVVLVIQTAVRAFLARRAQLKQKHVTKLQAAVRGHLVRRRAVGSLRCVQAIVKMQVLVRARQSNLIAEGSSIKEKLNVGRGSPDPTDEAKHLAVLVSSNLLSKEQKPENNSVNVQIEQEAKTDRLPDASPRSHITVPESQGTPSSQVSVNPKKIKSEKSGSIPKRRSAHAGKKSPSKSNHAPGTGTASAEQLPKDHKNEKRRNSFSSTKAGHVDQEARDNSNSSSLPSYMQATKSSRAKAIPNSSPRSSLDVHNKDEYIKKRHSLPGSNGRQGSPRIQRSLSNAQHGAKGNGTQSPQERKWQR